MDGYHNTMGTKSVWCGALETVWGHQKDQSTFSDEQKAEHCKRKGTKECSAQEYVWEHHK